MAKARSARGGRKGKKKTKKSARRPKQAKRTKKRAGRKQVRRKVRARVRKKVRPARRAAKRPVRKVARKAVNRKAPATAKAPASAKASASGKAPASAKATAGKTGQLVKVPKQLAAPKKLPRLDRDRKRLADADIVPSAPSTLGYEGGASAARSGRSEMRDAITKHTETGPVLTGGDVDANWEDAYAVGDEAPGGDNPTPDQDRVDDIGKALGVQYADNEELKGAEKIIERDRHRWELDPASSDDYVDRKKEED